MTDTPEPDDNEDLEPDAQDRAEIWDEDNIDTDMHRVLSADQELDFDERPTLFDETARLGDEDDDEAVIGDDLDDEDIVTLARDAEGGDDAEEDDLFGPGQADEFDDDEDDAYRAAEDDPDVLDHVADLSPDEVELEDAGDLNNTVGAEGSAKRFEASHLSDEDLEDLGYSPDDASPDIRVGEPRSFDPAAGRTAAENARHHLDDLLDQGVEETFPASDPVSVKHIT